MVAESAANWEERFARLWSVTSEGIVIHEQGIIVDANPAFAAMFGYTPEELTGRSVIDLAAPQSRETVAGHIQNASEGLYFATGRRKDGGTFVGEVLGRAATWQGRPVRVTLVRDVTHQVRAEEEIRRHAARLQILNDTSHAFNEATADYTRLLDTIARRTVELLGDACTVRLLSEDGEWLSLAVYFHRDPAQCAEGMVVLKRHPLHADEGLAGRVVRSGQPVLIAELTAEEATEQATPVSRAFVENYPYFSAVAAPLRSQGRVIGCIALSRHTPGRPYTLDDQRLLEDLADRAALAIANGQLFLALRREREEINAALRAEIATRAATEERLHAQGRFLDSIIENIPDMVFVKDAAELRFVRFNRAGEELLGHGRADLLGKNDYDLFPKHEADFFTAKDREVLAGRVVIDIPSEPIHTKHKGTRQLHTKKIPVLSADGSAAYLLGISEDVTEIVRMRAALQQSEKLASIGLLSAGIAHEINNPLAYIANNLHVLERDVKALMALADLCESAQPALARVDPEAAARVGALIDDADLNYVRGNMGRLLTRTREGVQRVTRIVDSLRALARTDRPDLRPTDLRELVDASVEMLRGRLERRAIKVDIDCGDDPTVLCVPTLLTQVLLNLLTNAMHAVEAAHADGGGRIRVVSRRVGDERVIEVIDNGAGVSAEVLPRLFDPFFTTKPVGEGTGLGLSISHSIVAGHDGRIEVESHPGEGACFRIHLPLEPRPGPA